MVGSRFWRETNGGVKFTLVAMLFLLTFMATSYFFDRRFDVSAFMWLPKEARVIEYRNSPTGECYVRFAIAKGQNIDASFKKIWAKNTSAKPTHNGPDLMQADIKGLTHILHREGRRGVFVYEVRKVVPMSARIGSGTYLAPASPVKVAPTVKGP